MGISNAACVKYAGGPDWLWYEMRCREDLTIEVFVQLNQLRYAQRDEHVSQRRRLSCFVIVGVSVKHEPCRSISVDRPNSSTR